MCGIAGILNLRQPVDLDVLHRMTNSLRHRGPDDEGYCLFNIHTGTVQPSGGSDTDPRLPLPPLRAQSVNGCNLAFGHRRLSILDLSPAGHQPMASPDRSCWLVFNGEIYNYIELREDLRERGHQFHTGSDTEVILAAYQQWGPECVQRF